jgi:hypothetical protein
VLKSSLAQQPIDVGKAELLACCRYMPAANERLE